MKDKTNEYIKDSHSSSEEKINHEYASSSDGSVNHERARVIVEEIDPGHKILDSIRDRIIKDKDGLVAFATEEARKISYNLEPYNIKSLSVSAYSNMGELEQSVFNSYFKGIITAAEYISECLKDEKVKSKLSDKWQEFYERPEDSLLRTILLNLVTEQEGIGDEVQDQIFDTLGETIYPDLEI